MRYRLTLKGIAAIAALTIAGASSSFAQTRSANSPSAHPTVTSQTGGINTTCADSLSRPSLDQDSTFTITFSDTLVSWSCGDKELEYVDVALVISEGSVETAGFDFLVTFDSLGATLLDVEKGPALKRNQWNSFFTHRILPPVFLPQTATAPQSVYELYQRSRPSTKLTGSPLNSKLVTHLQY